jgi:transcription antitermination factor NusG
MTVKSRGAETIDSPKMSLNDRFSVLDLSRFIDLSREEYDRQGDLDAEIVEGVKPKWHVIEAFPGQEFKVRDTLAERRFGVFFPTYRVWEKNRYGVTVMKVRRLISQYLFVFVWDIDRHWTRITGVDGVSRILKDGNEAAIIKDEVIAHLRVLEVYVEEKIEFANKNKKPKRRKKKHAHNGDDDTVKIYPARWVKLDGEWVLEADALDAENRRAVFHKAIGLA